MSQHLRGSSLSRKVLGGAVLAALLLPLGGLAAHAEPEGAVVQAKQPIKDSYIVVLHDARSEAKQPAVQAAATDLSRRYGGQVKATFEHTLRGFAVHGMSEQQARRIAADPAVRKVYQDGTTTATGEQSDPTWGLDRVDQRDLPLDNRYRYNNEADASTVYVVDTGIIKDNPDFEGRATIAADFLKDGQNGVDCNGHGTHVAGTVASKTYGVAKKAKIVALRVLDCQGRGPDSATVEAMEWIAANGVRNSVVNMSLGFDQAGVGDEALKNATAKGHLFVVAAGNDNKNACDVSPARVPEAVTVGGTAYSNGRDGRYSGSNHGSCVDISAPAVNVESLGLNNGSTATMTGTSMATPHVAGAAAMYRAWRPDETPQQVHDALAANATSGKIPNLPANTPDKLLYTGFIGSGGNGCPPATNGKATPIPDAGDAIESPVTVSSCAGNAPASTSVSVDIKHPYPADLAIDLVTPSGKVTNLKKAGGVDESDGVRRTYTVDVSAETRNGTWKLRVADVQRFDSGVLNSWTLTL
ncbi:S8 family peptidase [Streptoalloteichus hindustanus]|uniref:Serine protease, subtilisin family n=1 Tax=Streptoalloteichus hindustanus TaxID=2017 RepID=A0A1M5MY97_STRHI|nr:S8 family peptidase [Streptoalloteichus hindustanus]SHG82316.1 Serine protease, subtilisin family [Streptoalloteichus hindustanus]